MIFGDGEQSRDFTYVDNTVDGTVLAGSAEGVAGETFNLACGEATTLNQLLEQIGELSGEAGRGDPRRAPARRPDGRWRTSRGPGRRLGTSRRSISVRDWRKHSSITPRSSKPAEDTEANYG